MLTLQDDLTVENMDGFVRQQIQSQTILPGAEHPEHNLLSLPDRNEMY